MSRINQNIFGPDYSQVYDALYHDKDYEQECDFLEAIFNKYGNGIRKILDLGCGTAGHALILARRGYAVTGVDRSEMMLQMARQKVGNAGESIELIKSDITSLSMGRIFDAVISMFSVMNYLTTDEALSAACAVARGHLKNEGIFIFDAWHGPAVLNDKPVRRVKEVQSGKEKILRVTEPIMNLESHTVEVNFRVTRQNENGSTKEFNESHLVRYFIPEEMGFLLKNAGFSQVVFCPFLKLDQPLTDKDWHMAVIARASGEEG